LSEHCQPSATATLIDLLSAVASIPPAATSCFNHPAFVALREYCQQRFPGAGSKDGLNFALSAALDRLGVFARSKPARFGTSTVVEAARRLEAAFAATHVQRTHLCPLDVADDFAEVSFGPNAVRDLTYDQLQEILAPAGSVAETCDPRFAQFRWLVVRETVPLAFEPGRRALPFLFDMTKDFAQIEPHKRRFPAVVERALFATLLAPWEDLVTHTDLDWRPFQTPWVYTVDEDLFVRPPPFPSADTLSWEPDYYTDYDGETVEVERPVAYRWQDAVEGVSAWLNDDRWRQIEAALASELFSTPIVHFFVSAFLATEIDEFMGHLTALEAGLGLRADRAREKTLGSRVQALLADAGAAVTYGKLFNLRSEYVHGRTMSEISGADRTDARRLARRVVNALVENAQSLTADRESHLVGLAPSKPPRPEREKALRKANVTEHADGASARTPK